MQRVILRIGKIENIQPLGLQLIDICVSVGILPNRPLLCQVKRLRAIKAESVVIVGLAKTI